MNAEEVDIEVFDIDENLDNKSDYNVPVLTQPPSEEEPFFNSTQLECWSCKGEKDSDLCFTTPSVNTSHVSRRTCNDSEKYCLVSRQN